MGGESGWLGEQKRGGKRRRKGVKGKERRKRGGGRKGEKEGRRSKNSSR